MMKKILEKEHGYFNILALVLLIALCVIVFAYMDITQGQLNSTEIYKDSINAFYNADSGVENIISKLYKDPLYDDTNNLPVCSSNPNGKQLVSTLNGGEYSVCISDIDYGKIYTMIDTDLDGIEDTNKLAKRKVEIISKGQYKDNIKTITMILEIDINVYTSNQTLTKLDWRY